MSADKYGEYFWGVDTRNSKLSIFADDVVVTESGALEFIRNKNNRVNMIIAPGEWICVNAISLIDGDSVAIDVIEKRLTDL